MTSNQRSCNLTLFNQWTQEDYSGSLLKDSTFWIYQSQTFFRITNDIALHLSTKGCKHEINSLLKYKVGKWGPVDIQTASKVMCSSICLESDYLHEEALKQSGCTCIELSTQPLNPSFSISGDFCVENSAVFLCNIIGFCGVWNCRLDDFMCPRLEFNKKHIDYKNTENCLRLSSSASSSSINNIVLTSVLLAYLVFIFRR